jgi:hypothetical protein
VRRLRVASPMAVLIIIVVTMAGMAITGAPPWAMLLAIAVLVLLPTEERD